MCFTCINQWAYKFALITTWKFLNELSDCNIHRYHPLVRYEECVSKILCSSFRNTRSKTIFPGIDRWRSHRHSCLITRQIWETTAAHGRVRPQYIDYSKCVQRICLSTTKEILRTGELPGRLRPPASATDSFRLDKRWISRIHAANCNHGNNTW